MEFPGSTERKLGESIRVNLSFRHICSLLNHESGKTLEGGGIKEQVGNSLRFKICPYPILRKDGLRVRKRIQMMIQKLLIIKGEISCYPESARSI